MPAIIAKLVYQGGEVLKTFDELMLAETSEHEFKEALEIRKARNWLKTVSAFANGAGGTIYFGIADDRSVRGLDGIHTVAEKASELIKARINPQVAFHLTAEKIEDKDVLVLAVTSGESPPYFYQGDGSIVAYVRFGNESIPADATRLRELALKAKNLSFDSLSSGYRSETTAFTVFAANYRRVTDLVFTPKDLISFGMCSPDGILTNAGLLFADDCPMLQARVFCTRWNGLDKSSGSDEAIDDKEFEGDLITQLRNSHEFIRMNSKVRWRKMSDHRVNKPDYADRAVFEALANALMHRDYAVSGSEVHVDMYDDRLEIYSPGGMPDGTLVQERDIDDIPSNRRNPVIAEVFHRLEFVERRGSGLKKICTETSLLYGYTDDFAPRFRSTQSAFHVVLKNMNYAYSDTETHVVKDVVIDVAMENEIRLGRLLDELRVDGAATAQALAERLQVTARTIQRDTEELKKTGKIRRVGGNRFGHWEVLD